MFGGLLQLASRCGEPDSPYCTVISVNNIWDVFNILLLQREHVSTQLYRFQPQVITLYKSKENADILKAGYFKIREQDIERGEFKGKVALSRTNSAELRSENSSSVMANATLAQDFLPAATCFHLPDPNFGGASQRSAANLVTAVINIIASPLAVISNSLIVIALVASSRLRTPSNLLIGCLALSDVLVALTVQPGYIWFRLMENQHRSVPCYVRVMYSNTFYICCGVAFMTLSAVSYERLVAVRLRARYNNVFSRNRVLKFMAAIWVLNVALTSLQWAGINKISRGIHFILWFLCLLISVVSSITICFILRAHHCQLRSQCTISENIRRQREVKLTRNISFIVGVYLSLNMPALLVSLYHQTLDQDIKTYNHYSWTETLAFLNSCTNPLLCFWKNRQIRQGISAIRRRITCNLGNSDKNVTAVVISRYTKSVTP